MTGPETAAAYAAMHGPSTVDLARSMAEVGDMLHSQLCELAARPTVETAMLVAANLEGARLAVVRLHAAIVIEGEPGTEGEGDGR